VGQNPTRRYVTWKTGHAHQCSRKNLPGHRWLSSTGRCQRQCLHDKPLSYSSRSRTGSV